MQELPLRILWEVVFVVDARRHSPVAGSCSWPSISSTAVNYGRLVVLADDTPSVTGVTVRSGSSRITFRFFFQDLFESKPSFAWIRAKIQRAAFIFVLRQISIFFRSLLLVSLL